MQQELPTNEGMLRSTDWNAFREAGMLWFVNRLLHVFGWTITVSVDDKTGVVIGVYPERVKYRGFARDREELGYRRVTEFMAANAADLLTEFDDDGPV